jgi:adenosylcobyric acid synthase
MQLCRKKSRHGRARPGFRRRGVDVVPFKAQNMSNNARIVGDMSNNARIVGGGEIGSAQYLQALAAGVEPEVRMNPILVKPEGDNRSQVIVLGKPDRELSSEPWLRRPARLWPVIEEALKSLGREHDLVLLEGAGSPAEINLRASDLANMRTAQAADAKVILVADIDRGGAFAHLYGTWALLAKDERARLIARRPVAPAARSRAARGSDRCSDTRRVALAGTRPTG